MAPQGRHKVGRALVREEQPGTVELPRSAASTVGRNVPAGTLSYVSQLSSVSVRSRSGRAADPGAAERALPAVEELLRRMLASP